MATNFNPVRLGAQVVGIVDHPMGQPKQSLFHRSQV